MDLSIYLTFNGNCEEAINFYAAAFDQEIEFIQRYGDSPMETSAAHKDKIMHCTMDVNGVKLMASDVMEKQEVIAGTNVSISVNCNSVDEEEKVFAAMSAGGTVTMPLQDTFWGARFGMCTDKFGILWMFNFDHPKS